MFERSRWLPWTVLALWLLSLGTLKADEEESSAGQLIFVPPPVEGVISLGVYDSKAKLVRILKRAAPISSFKSGLNGLFVDWDGNDAHGKPVPSGKFFARGVLIGDVKVEGVAFHFNDWIHDADDPRIQKIISVALLSELRPAVLVGAPHPGLITFENNGSQSKLATLSFSPQTIKATGSNILAFDSTRLAFIDPTSGTQVSQQNLPDVRDADAFGNRTVVLTGSRIIYHADEGSLDLKPPADNLFRCAVLTSSIVVATKESNVWKLDGREFVAVDAGETGELLDMSAGTSDSVWLLVKTGTATLLKQIGPSGQILREIALPPDLQAVTRLGASRNQDALLLISDSDTTQRVIGVRFQVANQGKSVWEKWFDRSLTTFRFFDLREGKVVPAEAKIDSPPVFVKPANNPMENTRQANFQLTIYTDDTGAWVASVDGLPLIQVCETKDIKQARWISDGANGMRVYVSDGTVVEEYHLTSLENLFRFDAGSFD
jgi:hypothetical protein